VVKNPRHLRREIVAIPGVVVGKRSWSCPRAELIQAIQRKIAERAEL